MTRNGLPSLCLELAPSSPTSLDDGSPTLHPDRSGQATPSAGTSEVVPAPRSGRSPAPGAAIVPPGATFHGRLRAQAVVLHGHLIGDIECGPGPVMIHATGQLHGQARVRGDVMVAGTVDGTGGGDLISSSGRLVLRPGARVLGDVRCVALEIHEGATLQGAARAYADGE